MKTITNKFSKSTLFFSSYENATLRRSAVSLFQLENVSNNNFPCNSAKSFFKSRFCFQFQTIASINNFQFIGDDVEQKTKIRNKNHVAIKLVGPVCGAIRVGWLKCYDAWLTSKSFYVFGPYKFYSFRWISLLVNYRQTGQIRTKSLSLQFWRVSDMIISFSLTMSMSMSPHVTAAY